MGDYVQQYSYDIVRPVKSYKQNLKTVKAVLAVIFGLLIVTHFANKTTLVPPIVDLDKQMAINRYMETNGGINASEPHHINGILNNDTSRVYCENTYYGQHDRYAYAIVFCGEYSWKYSYREVFSFYDDGRAIEDSRRPIKITREVELGEAYSIRTRFLIADSDDFVILGFDQPDITLIRYPGSSEGLKEYYDNEKDIFPFNINEDEKNDVCMLRSRAAQRFRNDNKDAPMPDRIDEIWGQKDPVIVYGVDNGQLASWECD